MSIRLMTQVWDKPCNNCLQKLVLLALADNANDEGFCWPSIATIAKKCSLGRRSVMRQIANFEREGVLKVDRAVNRSNRYHLVLGSVHQAPGVVPIGHQGSAYQTPPVVPIGHPIRQLNRQRTVRGKEEGPPLIKFRLSDVERIGLEKEKKELKEERKRLLNVTICDDKSKQKVQHGLDSIKARIGKINVALFIPL